MTRATRIRHHLMRAAAAACAALGTIGAIGLGLQATSATARAEEGQRQCQAGIENYITETPWTNTLFNVEALHEQSTGKGVTVAIIDSGVSVDNPHLVDAIVEGTSYVPDDDSHGKQDVYNHGTIVAGIIGARRINGSSLVGIAPDAKIMPIRVFEALRQENGQTTGGPDMFTIAEGIRYAVDHGADVINISMSDTHDVPVVKEAVAYADDHGTLVVASAGNRLTSSSTVDGMRYPAAYPQVVGVSAVTNELLSTEDAIHGTQVDVVAPGANVASTIPSGIDCAFSDGSSTSYATAFVSGQAALIAERYPDETPAQWKQRILATANRAHPDERDDEYGWGVIDPIASLNVALSDDIRGPSAEGGAARLQADQTTERVTLVPLHDPNALAKRIVMLMTIATVVICATAWLYSLRRRDNADSTQA
ncbi:S8 family serine peptidase [Bifidobacterium criceti]|uniref:Subtilisin-type proteinase n=1 Tax=Bifidobacterium criceti TaxID=1960969 RepID=A0A2A2EIB4_9BIFI|nr:S8 family serine peptidase [Bifidobacterium criceti]PAU68919.1 subtilisin-type proteinase [Bifidobacterium criceti]